MVDPYSFRAVDIHQADYQAINEQLSVIVWDYIRGLIQDDPCGEQFLELIRPTVLQIILLHSPVKNKIPGLSESHKARNKYIIEHRRRKLNARIGALKSDNPSSLEKFLREVNL